jgi:hypothetical protein
MNSFTVSPFYAGRSAAWRGATLDDVPGYYTDQQADEWERGWYSIMDDEADRDDESVDGSDE